MRRSQDRFLTTHTGSIVRPSELLEAAEAAEKDEGKVPAFERVLTAQVAGIVTKQAQVGLDSVNDGEFGKSSWSAYVLERMDGFEIRPDQLVPMDWLGRDRTRFSRFFAESQEMMGTTALPAEVCVGPIAYTGHAALRRDLDNLKAATAGLEGPEVFATSVAPASTAYSGINEYYSTEEEYIYAIADALREEYRAIHQAGFLLQVDDAVLANMYDHLIQDGPERYRRWAQLRVEALNHALEGIPEDRIRYHVCFGSWHVPHVADAPLHALVEFIVQVRAGAYVIEAANPRHEHEVDVWERTKLPDDRILVPGVITHHTTTVEHPELVARRIQRYAAIVGPERVIAGADCGFAQADSLQRVHPEVMWAKFGSLVEGARLASQRVWKVGSGRNGSMSTPSEATSGTELDTAPARDKPGKFAGQMVQHWQQISPPGPGELPRTPSEIQGPYFRLAAPERSNLLEPEDEPEFVLTGRVLNEKGRPIKSAVVNVWSSDAGGDYDMIGYRYTGYQVTDDEGRYEFTTIIPGCYYPRDAKHLHVMVQGISSPLVTQLYIDGEPGNYEDDFYHPALLVEWTEDENGVKHGSYDFVIKQVTEEENVTQDSLAARA